MKFPRAIKATKIVDKTLCFRTDMTDKDLVELILWKTALSIKLVTLAKLRYFYKTQRYSKEIYRLLKKNKKIKYLDGNLE